MDSNLLLTGSWEKSLKFELNFKCIELKLNFVSDIKHDKQKILNIKQEERKGYFCGKIF
jgi:hypothetical protein